MLLTSCLAASLHTCLSLANLSIACPMAYLLTCMHACLHACLLLACLLVVSLLVSSPACLLSCLLVCLLACLLASFLFACLLVCSSTLISCPLARLLTYSLANINEFQFMDSTTPHLRLIRLNIFTTATFGKESSGRCRQVAVRGGSTV